MTDPHDLETLLLDMARRSGAVLAGIDVSADELSNILGDLERYAEFARQFALSLREGEETTRDSGEPGIQPLDVAAVLAVAASKATEVVEEHALGEAHVTSLAAFFEQQADFCWSVTEWLRFRSGDLSGLSTRRAQAEPLPNNADELYRPWKPTSLLDDVLDSATPGKITAYKRVKARECHDARDFPDEPMSGAMMLEALGHAAVLAIKGPDYEGTAPSPVRISAKLARPAHAGDEVILRCSVTDHRLGFAFVDGEAEVEGSMVVQATFLFRVHEVREPASSPS
jgi:3-hydroxymyristoyl/3-hydroxydecanoyl-(acyl carrier protein) dehydratase